MNDWITGMMGVVLTVFCGTLIYHEFQDNDIPIAGLTHRDGIEEAALMDSIGAAPRVIAIPGQWVDMVCNVSAYCAPCEICCKGSNDGITASGYDVRSGNIKHFLASATTYPFGTVFRVPGYAKGMPVVCLDRGDHIQGNRLDLWFPTHQAALNWGRREITVQIWRTK